MKKIPILTLTLFINHLYSSTPSYKDERNFWHYPKFEESANINNPRIYESSKENRLKFWSDCAQKIEWFQTWDDIAVWDCPYAKWFVNGKLNIAYNCLDKHLKKDGDKVAFYWCCENGQEKQVTYKSLHNEVCRLANGLKSLGVRKGDIVAIYMPMTSEGIASMLACARIGAVHSVIFGGTGAGSFKEKVNDACAKVIITADVTYRKGKVIPLIDTVNKIIDSCPSVSNVVVLKREDNILNLQENSKFVSYKDLINQSSPQCDPEVMDSEDRLFVLYTSGTTGKPKGVIHTTGGYLVGVHNTFNWVFDYKDNDIFWCTADIGWITGHSYVVYGPMSNGASQIIYEGSFDYPNKGIAWEIVEKYKATIFYTAPTLVRTFMKWGNEWIDNHDISSLRLLGSIGEPLNPEAWDWYHKVVGQKECPIVDTWFQTETGAFVISPIPGLSALKPGSILAPLPGYDVGIYNDSGEEVSHGFLTIKSPFPSMMRGVLNNPQRYYDTYWAKWNGRSYYAGDFAFRDKDGCLWCQGRADEVLKISGHRIGTAETENTIVSFPGVAEAAVIGVPDSITGQRMIAFVVMKDRYVAQGNLEKNIQQHVSHHVGKYGSPSQIIFVSELPKTRSGKILRRLIANIISGLPIGDTTTLVNPHVMEELTSVCKNIH